MPFLSREHEFLFYSAPATGSTAIIDALFSGIGGEYYPETDIVSGNTRITPRKHATPQQMRDGGLMTPEILDFKTMVGVRNPFSFHVAKYLRNKTKRAQQIQNENSWINKLPKGDRDRYVRRIQSQISMSFSEYLRSEFRRYDQPMAVQAHFLDDGRIDFFIHQENISDDLERILAEIGIAEKVAVAKKNVTGALKNDQTYHDFYDEELKALVYEWNAPSFELFPEYSFEGFDPDKIRV
ncbi:hypothetical protein [Roseovarius sp. SYSU LYC5161]|uniref:hypothetical protein n=1 Tax=Roseovarius halophilus (ex Wu et al. 2025) TaxID=3376060 RepID=UPI00399C40E5